MKIAVMGAGSLGSYLGGRLVFSGQQVTFIDRGARLAALQTQGLEVRTPEEMFAVAPVHATDDPADVGPVDLVLFCVRAYDVQGAAEQLRPLLGLTTTVLPLIAGLGHLETLCTMLGTRPVLGGIAVLTANRAEPAAVERLEGPNRLEFGELGGQLSSRCRHIEAVLRAAGLDAKAVSNIKARMWRNLAGTCAMLVLAAMQGATDLQPPAPATRRLMRRIVTEITQLAQASGVALPLSLADKPLRIYGPFPPVYRPPLLIDIVRGQRLELDAQIGALCRIGRAKGIPTSVADRIYDILKPYAGGLSISE